MRGRFKDTKFNHQRLAHHNVHYGYDIGEIILDQNLPVPDLLGLIDFEFGQLRVLSCFA